MRKLFNFKENYKLYKDDMLQYFVNLERVFSYSTFVMFFIYFIYMKLRNELYIGDSGISVILCLCMIAISISDYLLVDKYIIYHEEKVLALSTMRNVLMLVILFYMDTYSNISFTLISSWIMFMSITNIIPSAHIAMISGFVIVNTIYYLFFDDAELTISLFFDVVVDNLFVAIIAIGVNLLFTSLKYKEFEYKRELIIDNNMDFLTKLYNRRYVQKVVTSVEGTNSLCAMALIDLDNFKKVNDNFGHIRGDELLIEVGDILKDCFTGISCISRLGGDEFLLFSENIEDTGEFMEKVVKFIDSFPITIEKDDISVSVSASAGIVFLNADTTNLYETMYRYADESMYKSKYNGKNQYFVAEV